MEKHLFTVFRTPIFADRGVIALIALVLWSQGDGGPRQIVHALFLLPVVFVGILGHELGHAAAVRRLGHGDARIVIQALGGVCIWRGNPPPPWRHRMLISLAGPAASFAMSAVGWAAMRWGAAATGTELDDVVAHGMFWLNLVWAIFNLLPVFPLDGGQALRAWLSGRVAPVVAVRRSLVVSGVVGAAMVVWGVASHELVLSIFAAWLMLRNWQEWQSLAAR